MRKTLMVVLTLVAGAAVGGAQPPAKPTARDSAASDSLFRSARSLLDDRQYRRAANSFASLAELYPLTQRAGDALYWQAWGLYQLGKDNGSKTDLGKALDVLTQYNLNYGKNTQMANDATDLYSQIRALQARLGDADAAVDVASQAGKLRQATGCTGSRADDEMRMAALDGLLSMNSADAIPILEAVLKQKDPCKVEMRKKAVFLIAQKRGSSVVSTLLDVARSDPSTDVREQAIFWLGSSQAEAALPALDSIIFQSKDDEVRKKAIFAVSQQRRDAARQTLQRVAQDEKIPEEVRGDAIFWLGQNNIADLEFFKTLFKTTKSTELRSKILNGVATGRSPGASAWLLDIARDKTFDIETRKNAIFWASQRREMDLNVLNTLYDQSKGEDEMQEHILFIYSQRREPAATDKLMSIARTDPNVEMKKKALFWLSQKNDPRVKAFILELINK
ncbi:MAG TPA: HEAT repeat domain-containing protein [Gemmatimonadaceae bacterium]|nr:HEAT repeat domain-containing protein [Gemmatimonadaceae bacterium]